MLTTDWIKSSYSADNGACVQARWAKSSYSDSSGCVQWRTSTRCDSATCVAWRTSTHCDTGTCVAVGQDPDHPMEIHMGDTKDPDGPYLTFTPDSWMSLINGIKAGELHRS